MTSSLASFAHSKEMNVLATTPLNLPDCLEISNEYGLKLAHLLVEAEYKQTQYPGLVEENEQEIQDVCDALRKEGFIVESQVEKEPEANKEQDQQKGPAVSVPAYDELQKVERELTEQIAENQRKLLVYKPKSLDVVLYGGLGWDCFKDIDQDAKPNDLVDELVDPENKAEEPSSPSPPAPAPPPQAPRLPQP